MFFDPLPRERRLIHETTPERRDAPRSEREPLIQATEIELHQLREQIDSRKIEALLANHEELLFTSMEPFTAIHPEPSAEKSYQELKIKDKNMETLPKTLKEFVEKSRDDRLFAEQYKYIFSSLLEHDKANYSTEYIVKYTARKLTTLYCMYSGTNDALLALKDLQSALGEDWTAIIHDPECKLSVDRKENTLEIHSRNKDYKVQIQERREISPFENQKIEKRIPGTDERLAWTTNNFRRMEDAKYELTDNALGKIEDITIFNHGEIQYGHQVPIQQIRGLIRGLNPKRVNVVYSTSTKYDYRPEDLEYIVGNGDVADTEKRVKFRPVKGDIRMWARDEFLQAINPASGKRVLMGSNAARMDAETDSTESPPGFNSQGGDWRAIGPYLFIGKSFMEAVKTKMETENISNDVAQQKITEEYEKLFGRKVIYVDKSPTFHLDVFTTFLPNENGKPSVAIADLSQTKEILQKMTPAEKDRAEKRMLRTEFDSESDTPKSIMRKWNFQHDLYSGLTTYASDLGRNISDQGSEMDAHVATAYTQTQAGLDKAAEWFRNKGFEVIRIPTGEMITNVNVLAPEPTPQTYLNGERLWQSYNNCLVEAYVDNEGILQKHIYVPSFGLPVEETMIRKFNELGYEVHPVKGLQNAAKEYGSLNCLTSEFRTAFDENKPPRTHLLYMYNSADEEGKKKLKGDVMSLVAPLKEVIRKNPENFEQYDQLDKILKQLKLEDEMIPFLEKLREEKTLSRYGCMMLIEKLSISPDGTAEEMERALNHLRENFSDVEKVIKRFKYEDDLIRKKQNASGLKSEKGRD